MFCVHELRFVHGHVLCCTGLYASTSLGKGKIQGYIKCTTYTKPNKITK